MVGESQPKQAGQPPLLRASTHFDVSREAHGVLAFQHHVHHIVLLIGIVAQELAHVRAFVVHLDVLHRVVRQVVEHHPVVALEEVGAVQRQVIHAPPVHQYLAVVLQRHARQLTDKSVEHRPLRHVEGIGVIHQRVAVPHQLHLRGRHHHLVERLLQHRVALLQVYPWGIYLLLAFVVPHLHRHIARLIPFLLRTQDDVLRLCRQREVEQRIAIVGIGADGIYHGAVGCHQRHLRPLQSCLQE